MSGQSALTVQPASITFTAVQATQPYSGVPAPGVANGPAAVGGVATCRNLVADSPPSLLQDYEIYGFSIPGAIILESAGGALSPNPNLVFSLSLMVNEDVAYTESLTPALMMFNSGIFLASVVFAADLTNTLRVGARDRLGILLTGTSDTATASPGFLEMLVGVQYVPSKWVAAQARVFYNVIDLPASRRI